MSEEEKPKSALDLAKEQYGNYCNILFEKIDSGKEIAKEDIYSYLESHLDLKEAVFPGDPENIATLKNIYTLDPESLTNLIQDRAPEKWQETFDSGLKLTRTQEQIAPNVYKALTLGLKLFEEPSD